MYFSVTHMHNYTMHANKWGYRDLAENKQDTFALLFHRS